MQSTVNTNVSSALNTQKLINSYDGGVQTLVLVNGKGATYAAVDNDTTAQSTLGITAITATNLLNVSTLTLNHTIASAGANTGGLEVTLTFPGASGAASSAARDAWEKATHTRYNVWSVDLEYTLEIESGQVGKNQLCPGGLSVESSTTGAGNDGQIKFTLPKTSSAGAGAFSLVALTLHKKALGIDGMADSFAA